MRKLLVALGLSFPAVALAGCNTISGIGEDLETVGDEIEDTAEDAKD